MESDLWRLLKKELKGPGRDFVRVENPIMPGTPDVNYSINSVDGWIELKEIPSLPKRAGSAVRVPHFMPQQRLWIRRRGSAGGRVFVLLRVKSPVMYFLLPWTSWEWLGDVPVSVLKEEAHCWWREGFDDLRVLKVLVAPPLS